MLSKLPDLSLNLIFHLEMKWCLHCRIVLMISSEIRLLSRRHWKNGSVYLFTFLFFICIGLLSQTEAMWWEIKLHWMLRFPNVGNTSFKPYFSIDLTKIQSSFNIKLLILLIWRLYGSILAPKQTWIRG